MNRIPRNFKSITGTFLSGNVKNKRFRITHDEHGYHAEDLETGKVWHAFVSQLRNEAFFRMELIELEG